MLRILVLCLSLLSSSAWAVTEYSFATVTGWHSTLTAAGQAYASYYGYTFNSCSATPAPGTCSININGNNNTLTVATREVASQCQAGVPRVTNFTRGYTRTSDVNDDAYVGGTNALPTSFCDAGCSVSTSEVVDFWVSQTPTSQGLYRNSVDLLVVPTGATCTVSTSATDKAVVPTTPAPTCPGFVGEINGVKGCYGTANSPVNVIQGERPTKMEKPGNPAAGDKPASGAGSGSDGAGRTPSTGSGENSGGPASAAGPTATGFTPKSTDTTKEQQNCGAPGQPKCGIDETGTPIGKDSLTGFREEFDAKLQERQAALATVTSASGKDTSWGVMPLWTQSGQCSPWRIFVFPAVLNNMPVDLDLCVVKPYADGVSNFIWISLAFFGITSMVFATMTSKGT